MLRFAPVGEASVEGGWIVLALDELEAMRLADIEDLYQEGAAARMGVSRTTFARILNSARHKVALALSEGRTLVIEGGAVCERIPWRCTGCGHTWGGTCAEEHECPRCHGLGTRDPASDLPPRCQRCPRRKDLVDGG
jgi:uncharacterized protein